jgi:uncharacterized membrane protein
MGSILRSSQLLIRKYICRLSFLGLIGAGLFFSLSMAPSLIPRTAPLQGILTGFCAAVGFWLGLLIAWFWDFLELPSPSGGAGKLLRFFSSLSTIVFAGYWLWQGADWQSSLRQFLGLEPLQNIYTPIVILIALPVAFLLIETGHGFSWVTKFISRQLQRIVPRRVSLFFGILLTALFLGYLVSGTIGRLSLRALDEMFLALDQLIDDNLEQPTQELATGSPSSLISWEDLGRQGHRFVTSGPDQEAIEAFTGLTARQPLRVYVGLGAAATPDKRARLAVEEMKRVGAFERSVLVIATPTGTGWLDNAAVDPLEFLHHGDTAIVAQQYSYLTSYISLFLEPDFSKTSATALFNAVYQHWKDLPHDSRPSLYLHGLSLGAAGSEQSMNLLTVLGDLIQGAVWSGPPFSNPNWSTFTQGRNPDSSFWLPTNGDGSLVRFTNQHNALDLPGARWGPVRLVYLQYASDPITFFSPDLFYRKPDWLRGKRGPDVSPELRWLPIVTGLQVAFDMIGASSIGQGLGHLYAPDHYIDAWIAVTEPDGWSETQVNRLKKHFRN